MSNEISEYDPIVEAELTTSALPSSWLQRCVVNPKLTNSYWIEVAARRRLPASCSGQLVVNPSFALHSS